MKDVSFEPVQLKSINIENFQRKKKRKNEILGYKIDYEINYEILVGRIYGSIFTENEYSTKLGYFSETKAKQNFRSISNNNLPNTEEKCVDSKVSNSWLFI